MTTRPSSSRALRLPCVPRTSPSLRIARAASITARRSSATEGTRDRLLVRRLEHAVLRDDRRDQVVRGHVEGHVHRLGAHGRDAHTEHASDLVTVALLDLDLVA